MASTNIPIQKYKLHQPPLEEVAEVLQAGLKKNFTDVQVALVECPDLRQKPFMLAEKGLCGHPRLADVGGVPNLVPKAKLEKKYNLESVAQQVELPGAFVIGAGAGPNNVEGVNCEEAPSYRINRLIPQDQGVGRHFTDVSTLAGDGPIPCGMDCGGTTPVHFNKTVPMYKEYKDLPPMRVDGSEVVQSAWTPLPCASCK